VVAILGPRQIGKTTLARQYAERVGGQVTRFDLENPWDISRLEDPLGALEGLRGLVVLDEVQRRPGDLSAPGANPGRFGLPHPRGRGDLSFQVAY